MTAPGATRTTQMTGEQRFLAAANLQPVDATPVWFMRQAGRSFADYRALRQKHDILEIARTPELCTEVTLMPVNALGVDGAVLFADIMLPLEPMGVSLEIQPDLGPVIHHPIRSMEDVKKLRRFESREGTGFVMDAIKMIRKELNGKAAVIGFSGSPFTLACYLVEGRPSKDYAKAKAFMFSQPEAWAALMEILADQMADYLRAQIEAGAQVVQVFDSWVGSLAPVDYEQSVLPWARKLFDGVRDRGAPTISFGTGNASLLELMSSAGSDLMSVDWRLSLDDAWKRIGYDKGIQGNVDPVRVLAGWDVLAAGADDVLRRAENRNGHIFNLGHGVLPETNPEMLARLVDYVHEQTRR
jgi:uroporphyrinogen decarboxylase